MVSARVRLVARRAVYIRPSTPPDLRVPAGRPRRGLRGRGPPPRSRCPSPQAPSSQARRGTWRQAGTQARTTGGSRSHLYRKGTPYTDTGPRRALRRQAALVGRDPSTSSPRQAREAPCSRGTRISTGPSQAGQARRPTVGCGSADAKPAAPGGSLPPTTACSTCLNGGHSRRGPSQTSRTPWEIGGGWGPTRPCGGHVVRASRPPWCAATQQLTVDSGPLAVTTLHR